MYFTLNVRHGQAFHMGNEKAMGCSQEEQRCQPMAPAPPAPVSLRKSRRGPFPSVIESSSLHCCGKTEQLLLADGSAMHIDCTKQRFSQNSMISVLCESPSLCSVRVAKPEILNAYFSAIKRGACENRRMIYCAPDDHLASRLWSVTTAIL